MYVYSIVPNKRLWALGIHGPESAYTEKPSVRKAYIPVNHRVGAYSRQYSICHMYVPLLDLHCLNGFANIWQVEWNNLAQGNYMVTEKHNILCIEEDPLTV